MEMVCSLSLSCMMRGMSDGCQNDIRRNLAACGKSVPSVRRKSRGSYVIVQAGLWNAIKSMGDFESWAPRSSRAWRLGKSPSSDESKNNAEKAKSGKMSQTDIDVLNLRLESIDRSDSDEEYLEDDEGISGGPGKSFFESSDEDFAMALNDRIEKIAASRSGNSRKRDPSADQVASEQNADVDPRHLSGRVLSELLYKKYGKMHDVSFVRRDIPGKTLVSLNIYHAYLGQRSFPMKEQDYLDKLDGVSIYLQALGQAERVVAFLQEPIAPRRGLPSRPIVGSAVNIQLDLTKEQVAEFFGGMN